MNGISGDAEEERGRSEATIRFVVNDVHQLDGNPRYSAVTYIRHLPWRLRVMRDEMSVTVGLDGTPGESTEYVRVFLCCNYKPHSKSWWCTANADVTIVAQSDTGNNSTRHILNTFTSMQSAIVFDPLIAFNDLVNPEKGFIKNNTIVVEAKVSAGPAYDVIKPSNMGHIYSLIQWKSVDIYPQLDYFMNESKSDVIFKVEGKRIPALREILCFQCDYFRSMFSGNFSESQFINSLPKEIEIKDTTHEAFKTIIWYLYSYELAVDSEELLIDLDFQFEVYRLADRFQIKRLLDYYENQLKANITEENLELVSRIAFNYEINSLVTSVKAFIDQNFEQLVSKDRDYIKQINDLTNEYFMDKMLSKFPNNSTQNIHKNVPKKTTFFKRFNSKYFRNLFKK